MISRDGNIDDLHLVLAHQVEQAGPSDLGTCSGQRGSRSRSGRHAVSGSKWGTRRLSRRLAHGSLFRNLLRPLQTERGQFSVPVDVAHGERPRRAAFLSLAQELPQPLLQFRPPAASDLKRPPQSGNRSARSPRSPPRSASPGRAVYIWLDCGRMRISAEWGETCVPRTTLGALASGIHSRRERAPWSPCDPETLLPGRRSDVFSLPGNARGR